MINESVRQERVMLPSQATERGDLMYANLRSDRGEVAGVLCQLSKLDARSRKALIHFYPTLEQAYKFFGASPLKFEAQLQDRGAVTTYTATEVWITKPSAQGTNNGISFITHCSGRPTELHMTRTASGAKRRSTVSGQFIATPCFVTGALATDKRDAKLARKYGWKKERVVFDISKGAEAEFKRIECGGQYGRDSVIREFCHVLEVRKSRDWEVTTEDARVLLLLASFGSRERSVHTGYSFGSLDSTVVQHWFFNAPQIPKRRDRGHEPLLPRNFSACGEFLKKAFALYSVSDRGRFIDSAIYSLLPSDRTLETSIVRLFSGIHSALLFSWPPKNAKKRPRIEPLYKSFRGRIKFGTDDLWPLFDRRGGPSLYDLRNAIVHGDVFSPEDFLALSYASQHLHWILERVTLTSLGWDVDQSAVSPRALGVFYGYQEWNKVRGKLKLK